MKRVRAFFVIAWVIIAMIISLPLFLYCLILHKLNPLKEQRFAQKYIQGVFSIILKLSQTTLIVKGMDNIPLDRAVVYMGNHRSYYDIVSVYSKLPTLTGIVAKDDIEKVPVFNHWMNIMHCLFLDRKDTRKALKTILKGIEYVKNGCSMLVFPEGTRGPSNTEVAEFKEGSMKLATKPGAPIIPVAITNSAEVFEKNGGLRLEKKTMIVEFASPVETKGLDREAQAALSGNVRSIILEMLQKNIQEVD